MAKSQKRSTREIRKPKQDKTAPKPENSTFGSQVKLAANANTNAKAKGAKGKS